MERVKRRKQFNINLIFCVEIPPYNETVSNTHKFTGHERDYYNLKEVIILSYIAIILLKIITGFR